MAVKLGLVVGDLPGQMRVGFGEPMRAVRDPPDYRAAVLRATQPCPSCFLPFQIGTLASPDLLADLLRGLTDPLDALAVVPQPRRHSFPITVIVIVSVIAIAVGPGRAGRGVFGGVHAFGFGDDLADLGF
jgi:hypothetical protein